MKGQKEWTEYSKSGEKPIDIPSDPHSVYKDKGWISWGDFLGTGRVAVKNRVFLNFEEASSFVRALGLKNEQQWKEYCQSGNKPDNLPVAPDKNYKNEGWLSWGDFLGTKIGFKGFLSFHEAREFVRKLNIKKRDEWNTYCQSGKKPDNIPSYPCGVYKDKGWVSVGDWLGTGRVADQNRVFLNFEESRSFVRGLGLIYTKEWKEYCQSGNKPDNIPAAPWYTYKNKGWVSIGDWLGTGSGYWNKTNILTFLKSLQTQLNTLDSVELITIITVNNIAKKIGQIGLLEKLTSTQANSRDRSDIIKQIIDVFNNTDETQIEELNNNEQDNIVHELETILSKGDTLDLSEEQEVLVPFNPIDELHLYDNEMFAVSQDDENADFLLKYKLKKLWNNVLNNNVDIEQFSKEEGKENFTIIKNWFFDEYNKVMGITKPNNYIFKYEPNLMQKLITHRLITEKRYGNWSGTGAGKTLSAIFAGRYANAKNTVIMCNNATVEGWVNSINEYFTNNKIYTKRTLSDDVKQSSYTVVDKYNFKFKENENNYLVLNYETFQLEDGEYIVSELLRNNVIDYIILDEVQNVKQRNDEESNRRSVVNKLVIHAKEKNENLLVLAMSATPIINNLTEPKKLIELLTGESHEELKTFENIINGVEMYKALTRYGLRYIPKYDISINEEIIKIDGEHLANQIIKAPRSNRAVLEFEKILLQSKLDGIKHKINKGTLIYTQYIEGITEEIGKYVTSLGFTYGYYIGEDKTGIKLFKEGKIDILIGSAPISTGVDGIQYVCNTLIPIVLPWTNSEYQQLIGRVNRQGSVFNKVNIYIPQVVIKTEENNVWSWDDRRYNIIKRKATLADLALDGRIPDKLLPSQTKLLEDAKKELVDWINRVENGNMITFEREELNIHLNPQQIERNKVKLGEFSELNKNWSTSNSRTIHERLKTEPSEWYHYHTLYTEKIKNWKEIPYLEIAKKINVRPDWVVGDFGCGQNLLSKEITNNIYAFDHIAIDDTVISCDMKNVPIENNILDVAVFSLSLMGSNYKDYLNEAYRTLKIYGNLFISEPYTKWEGREDELKSIIETIGFNCLGDIKKSDRFIYIHAIKN